MPWIRPWAIGRALTACFVPLLGVLLGLGWWQLERAEQKARLEHLALERLSALANAPPADLGDVDFLRVRLTGRFEPGRYFLVDNRVVDGRAGYWVVQGFVSEDGRRWLVNRGWVAGPPTRDRLPVVETPTGRLEVMGVCWPNLGMLPDFGSAAWPAGWPKRVGRMNVERMSRELDTEALQVRLEPGAPGRLGPLPLALPEGAARHRGYAAQWFGLAVVLAVGYLLLGFSGRSP